MKILITGAAGFIGMHTAQRLIADGHQVVGIDNLNDYYDVQLKRDRLARLAELPGFTFVQVDVADRDALMALFDAHAVTRVVHLAAQAGVRYSITNPHAYGEANLVGFLNMLEACRQHRIEHLVYASSSSVYGGNRKMPFSEGDSVDHPVSLYAATKKANELMAHAYSHLYAIPTTGLRFFTVYGPWGRPDMAYFSFTKAIVEGRPIQVFNNGDMLRDFTYIDDIVDGVVATLYRPATADAAFDPLLPHPGRAQKPFRVFNIGNQDPVALGDFIAAIEAAVGKSAIKEMLPMQPGDVQATYADVSALAEWTGVQPKTSIRTGIDRFVAWYKAYYRVT
ncbi:NAD-dependent epimerase/dehydratase [Leptothrix cholodnii SP-6]|uniref:NAD-dependent epimerase/dehydratase n=1 Tax=Leptothrix cholodnii (strain ATCC 51168 / LMG 8142 / SP-6) TaxID=395495 RepID=B1Y058_LEPCP|nr:NAD-dependent epimerase [Leptothrix cholodnii]ACB35339.1 NAD-dependent epimerase/dehydratase [Leptothrix cholodnii SP-6]